MQQSRMERNSRLGGGDLYLIRANVGLQEVRGVNFNFQWGLSCFLFCFTPCVIWDIQRYTHHVPNPQLQPFREWNDVGSHSVHYTEYNHDSLQCLILIIATNAYICIKRLHVSDRLCAKQDTFNTPCIKFIGTQEDTQNQKYLGHI